MKIARELKGKIAEKRSVGRFFSVVSNFHYVQMSFTSFL